MAATRSTSAWRARTARTSGPPEGRKAALEKGSAAAPPAVGCSEMTGSSNSASTTSSLSSSIPSSNSSSSCSQRASARCQASLAPRPPRFSWARAPRRPWPRGSGPAERTPRCSHTRSRCGAGRAGPRPRPPTAGGAALRRPRARSGRWARTRPRPTPWRGPDWPRPWSADRSPRSCPLHGGGVRPKRFVTPTHRPELLGLAPRAWAP
jgi:hypothetical protein